MSKLSKTKKIILICILTLLLIGAFVFLYSSYNSEKEVEEEIIPLTSVSINEDDFSFYSCFETRLSYKFEPADATINKVSWISSDEDVIRVINGRLVPLKDGSATITLDIDGITDSVNVTVDYIDYYAKKIDEIVEGATYFDGILIANKSYELPSTYDPQGLNKTVQDAFDQMALKAKEDEINLRVASGYRSYDHQKRIYDKYCATYGQQLTDTFSARPGYSEHQTGLAIDVNMADDKFADTPEAEWLYKHAKYYGFIIRYPKEKEEITGYKYEPWHIRYVGTELSLYLTDNNLTLEEYFNIDSAYKK